MKLLTPISIQAADKSVFDAVRLTGSHSLILDCIKRGEDDEDVSRGELPKRKGRSIIIRVYDSLGGTSRGTIYWNEKLLPVKRVLRTNVLEDDLSEIEIQTSEHKSINITLRAFEVATFRLQL